MPCDELKKVKDFKSHDHQQGQDLVQKNNNITIFQFCINNVLIKSYLTQKNRILWYTCLRLGHIWNCAFLPLYCRNKNPETVFPNNLIEDWVTEADDVNYNRVFQQWQQMVGHSLPEVEQKILDLKQNIWRVISSFSGGWFYSLQ